MDSKSIDDRLSHRNSCHLGENLNCLWSKCLWLNPDRAKQWPAQEICNSQSTAHLEIHYSKRNVLSCLFDHYKIEHKPKYSREFNKFCAVVLLSKYSLIPIDNKRSQMFLKIQRWRNISEYKRCFRAGYTASAPICILPFDVCKCKRHHSYQ